MKRSLPRAPLLPLLVALPLALLGGCSDDGSTTTTGAGGAGASGGGTSTGGTGGGMGGSGATGGEGGMATGGGGSGGGGCTPGQTQYCYSGPPGTEIVGMCKAGLRTCLPDGTAYGACVGEIVPAAESCATPGDDDCDGSANEEGCACTPGATAPCYTGPMDTKDVGACKSGTQTCNAEGSAYGTCMGEVLPSLEVCATADDDDCDGATNEEGVDCVCAPNTTANCYTGPSNTQDIGDCKGGTKACNAQGTAYGPCVGEVVPGVETCAMPGDEDCNGQINEGGDGCVCTPNTTEPCYSGSPGTAGVGLCKAGTRACNAQGTAYGPCVGEIVPKMEDCTTVEDENCKGPVIDACGTATWLKRFGDNLDQDAWAVATDAAGNVIVAGQFAGTIDFGGGPLMTANTQPDMFIAKLDPMGNHLWSKRYGANGIDVARAVAIDANGDVLVTGIYQSTVDFGGGPFVSVGGTTDVFVLKLSAAAGAHMWSKSFGASGGDDGSAVAVDAAGDVAVAGHFRNTVDFGGGPLTAAGLDDVFVVRFSSAGDHQWSRHYGDAFNQSMRGVAFDAAGSVFFTGYFEGSVDFGGGTLLANGTSDAMLVKLSATGVHQWSKRFGAPGSQVGTAIAVDGAGNVVVTGNAASSVDFGGGQLVGAGMNDVFVAKYDTMGNHVWSKLAGDAQEQLGLGVAVDGGGNVVLVGRAAGSFNLGGGPIASAGANDVFIAKFDSAGAHLWSKRAGDALEQWGRAAAVDTLGNIFFAGRFQGTLDIGSGPETSLGGNDVFVGKLVP
jgi:hypothetical protein